jgi:ABC-type lipoprotein release transport system permease subunit
MNRLKLIQREMFFQRRRIFAALFAVTLAAGTLTTSLTLLRLHDRAAQTLLSAREQQTKEAGDVLRDEMRKATLKLSFNLLILPEDVDLKEWYINQESDLTFPEDYAERLVSSGIVTVRHILPMIQKRMIWPETGRTIVLIGTRGEAAEGFSSPRKPLIQPVPEGTIVLGHELHRSLGLKEGETVQLMGRELKIHRLHEERGSKDDITAWIYLSDAQELLGMDGKISSMLALECLCGGGMIDKIREQVASILPGTQVVEMGTKVIARAEARIQANAETYRQLEEEKSKQQELAVQRQRFAALLVPLILLLCAGWIGLLTFSDVRERRSEIGMLRAIGFRTHSLMLLFLIKAVWVGLIGGALGYAAAAGFCGVRLSEMEGLTQADLASVWNATNALIAMGGAICLMVIATWIPALIAAQTDPADVLREE